MFTELGRLFAPLAQLVQSISFTPRGPEVRILQGAQNGGYSSVGRASVCGSECRGFDSHYSPKKGPVPKWLKGVLCKSIIRQFESDRDLNITPSSNGRTSGFGPLNGSSNLSGVTKCVHSVMVTSRSPKPLF